MDILILPGLVCAAAGAWLISDFLLWRLKGVIVPATIEKFEKGKPVVSFETPQGEKNVLVAGRIMNMGYFFSKPKEGDIFNAVYREEPMRVRLFGYFYLLTGSLLFLPFLATLGIALSRSWLLTQLSFVLVFVLMFGGGWALMKIIRGNN